MEDYTYHFGPGEPKVLGAHMLEVCPSITTAAPRVEVHPLSIGGREDPVRLVFTADPGPASSSASPTSATASGSCSTRSTSSQPDEPMPKLPVAHAVWQPRPDMATALESWLRSGGPHHTCLSTAVDIEAIVDLAEILRTELVVIDEHTTTRPFANELRWNQAYYRSAPGPVTKGVPVGPFRHIGTLWFTQSWARGLRGVGGGQAGVVLADVGETVATALPQR